MKVFGTLWVIERHSDWSRSGSLCWPIRFKVSLTFYLHFTFLVRLINLLLLLLWSTERKSWSKKKKKTWNHDILRNHRRIEICKNHFHHHFHSHSPIQSNLLYSNSHSSHLIVPSSGLITKSSIPSNQSYPQSQPTDNTFTPIFNLHQKKQLPVRITQNVSQVKKNKNQSNSHSRFFKNGI